MSTPGVPRPRSHIGTPDEVGVPVSKGELGHDIEIDRAVFPVISTSCYPRRAIPVSADHLGVDGAVSDRAQEARLVRHA
jgi:hypothetical protein